MVTFAQTAAAAGHVVAQMMMRARSNFPNEVTNNSRTDKALE